MSEQVKCWRSFEIRESLVLCRSWQAIFLTSRRGGDAYIQNKRMIPNLVLLLSIADSNSGVKRHHSDAIKTQYITDRKSRRDCFHKRKNGLIKKVYMDTKLPGVPPTPPKKTLQVSILQYLQHSELS